MISMLIVLTLLTLVVATDPNPHSPDEFHSGE
jgi:hypothetical protein